VLVGRLGEGAIAASSALSTITIPWGGTLGATCSTMSSVRVGYHLGRGNGDAAKKCAWLVLHLITIVNVMVAILFLPLRRWILDIATNDSDVLKLGTALVPAMLVGTYLNLFVSNITSGVFSGMGRPIIATILSFGFELPMSIGGVAIYILLMKGNLLGVYWWQAISGGVEALVVVFLMVISNWDHWAGEARRRQGVSSSEVDVDGEENLSNETDALVVDTGDHACCKDGVDDRHVGDGEEGVNSNSGTPCATSFDEPIQE
jgi:MATE family multidrug resistance protein